MFNFKELIELWRSDNLLTQALNDSHVMLESTQEMFRESVGSLRHSDSGEIKMTVYDTDLLIFKSAGNDRNDGPDCSVPGSATCDGNYESIGYVGNAKNVVSVCALEDNDSMSGFSSWGPTDDGRVKPDLCANGVGLLSTDLGNGYLSISGTSMSSPSAWA